MVVFCALLLAGKNSEALWVRMHVCGWMMRPDWMRLRSVTGKRRCCSLLGWMKPYGSGRHAGVTRTHSHHRRPDRSHRQTPPKATPPSTTIMRAIAAITTACLLGSASAFVAPTLPSSSLAARKCCVMCCVSPSNRWSHIRSRRCRSIATRVNGCFRACCPISGQPRALPPTFTLTCRTHPLTEQTIHTNHTQSSSLATGKTTAGPRSSVQMALSPDDILTGTQTLVRFARSR